MDSVVVRDPAIMSGEPTFRGTRLLAAAEESGFEVLLTVDRNMPYQQSLCRGAISLVILEARTTNLEDLLALIPDTLTALEMLKPGEAVRIRTH